MHRNALNDLNYWINRKKRKPLILRGARQVGKSSLVRLFTKNSGLELAEINLEKNISLEKTFESLNLDQVLIALQDKIQKRIVPGKTLLFLDEVQATPKALNCLRYFYEECPQLAVIAAGSLLDFILKDHDFSMPVGRVEYLHIEPMSFGEFLEAKGHSWLKDRIKIFDLKSEWPLATHEQLGTLLREYYLVGGMPEAVLAHTEKEESSLIRKIHTDLNSTYRDDFSKYAKKKQLLKLNLLFDTLPTFVGKKIIYSKLIGETKAEEVRRCIELLCDARIVRQAFHTNCEGIPLASRIKMEVFKTYWLDIGLLNRLLGLDLSHLQYDFVHEGQLAEQFVAQQLSSSVPQGEKAQLYYWLREGKSNNAEVDFITQFNNEIIPIEVKSGSAGHLRSLNEFLKKHQSQVAIKFGKDLPYVSEIKYESIEGGKPIEKKCQLIHLPIYFAESLPNILEKVFESETFFKSKG